jgi:hypothetical protein
MKSFDNYLIEAKKETPFQYITRQKGIIHEVCEYTRIQDEYYYHIIDKFEDPEKAQKHCDLLNAQYDDRRQDKIKSIAERNYETDTVLEKANNIKNLCLYCRHEKDTSWCPIKKHSRIKKINGLTCKQFTLI